MQRLPDNWDAPNETRWSNPTIVAPLPTDDTVLRDLPQQEDRSEEVSYVPLGSEARAVLVTLGGIALLTLVVLAMIIVIVTSER